MGVVHSGEDETLKRAVAIKVLSGNLCGRRETQERFLLEARAAARLNHSNIVAVYDIGEEGDQTYIVMELVPGGSAQARIRSRGAIPWREATRIAADVCRGLAAAHAAGLIHRDIKPSNILLAADGSAKLADFGLAKAPKLVSTRLTQAGDILGTPQFMSPEHCSDEPLDERTDLYSLGATYYAMLVGKPPFDSPDVVKILYAHCSADVPDPRDAVPDLPPGCAAVVARAMTKSRTARYRSAAEMAAALEALLVVTGPEASPPPRESVPTARADSVPGEPTQLLGTSPSIRTRIRQHRFAAAFLGLFALGACVLGLGRWLNSAPAPTPAPTPAQPPALVPSSPREIGFRPRGKPLVGHQGSVNAISVAGGRIASGSDDATARVWPQGGGAPVVLKHTAALNAVALSPDGKTLATGGWNNALCLWDSRSGEKTTEFPTTAPIRSVAFSPSGKQLAVGTGYELLLFDVDPNLRLRARLVPNRYIVASVAFSADGKFLAACTYQRNMHRWDVATLAERHVGGFPDELSSVAISANGGRIAFASRTGSLHVWQPDLGQAPVQVEQSKRSIMSMIFVPGRDTLLVTGEWAGPLRLYDVGTGKKREIAADVAKVINAASFSSDGKILAAGCSDGTVRIWDVAPQD